MRRSSNPNFLALALVTGVSPFATDTYIAALPQVQESLRTTTALAQLTMTTFILGLALGQLVCGPLSDGLGRRRILVVSSMSFAVLSAACAIAPTIAVLLVARALQGFVGGCGVAVGRAVISDRYTGLEAAARYGSLASITFLTPVIAPSIGGLILLRGDWRTVFWFLTVLGALMAAAAVAGLPETLPPERRHGKGLRSAATRMGSLLRLTEFRGNLLVACLATAGFFTYIGGSSIVLQGQLGLSESGYALLFATNATAMALTGLVFRASVRRVGPARLRLAGLSISTLAALLLAVYALALDARLAPTWILLALMVGGMGLTIPATTAIAQHIGRAAGGTASALVGGITFTVGAFATALTGLLSATTIAGMASISAVLFLTASAARALTTNSLDPQ